MRNHTHVLLLCLTLTSTARAQVPDGWYVWGSFQGTAGLNGLFFSHPRDPLQALIEVENLPPALAYDPAGRRGAACVLYRGSDGALVAGERSPPGTSVDLHVLRLSGNRVVFAHLFSVGTSVGAGEIPQCGLLPDGRIVVAATDLTADSVLAQFQTAQYNWEGVGIVDTESGSVTPIGIANLNQFPGVLNGLAVSHDGATVYLGNYVSATVGDLWSVPITGGIATQVATLPCGASNLAVDNDRTVLVTTLNGPPNLFRYDPILNTTTPIATSSGPLNAIAVERVSGSYAIASANAGVPPRSMFWMTRTGQETLLHSPNRATISAVDVNPNPEEFGADSPGQATYGFVLNPNAGGLPTTGNTGFSLTLQASNLTVSTAVFVLGQARLDPPVPLLGAAIHVDPTGAFTFAYAFQSSQMVPLPIPNLPVLRGARLFAQSVHHEGGATLSASPGLEITIL
jgi:hypothetical protein